MIRMDKSTSQKGLEGQMILLMAPHDLGTMLEWLFIIGLTHLSHFTVVCTGSRSAWENIVNILLIM